MNQFSVNGVSRNLPISESESFGTLLDYLNNQVGSHLSLISSLKVDGKEIGVSEEADLASKPLAQIQSVEVTFGHPRELAEETLQRLILFSGELTTLSTYAASLEDDSSFQRNFVKLVEGLQTFMDGLHTARKILRAEKEPVLIPLDRAFTALLREVLEASKTHNTVYRNELLRTHLPRHLKEWASQGIPALIRSRDS